MFIFSTSIARDMDISHVKTAEEAVISMIETIYDDYKLDEDVVYTSLSIQEYLQAYDERSSEAEDLIRLQDLYLKLKNGESLQKLLTELTDQMLLIRHCYDPYWEVSVEFDENKKITVEAFSNVDNVFQYDAILKWIEDEK
ncbi:MAG: hypothetical protein D8H99_16990 [Streptococcus sp.]|nr:MAG: hypothetical protein D8H99_16990 [Streptococcus sp.]